MLKVFSLPPPHDAFLAWSQLGRAVEESYSSPTRLIIVWDKGKTA